MEAIILLGHGSRLPEASEDMERVAASLRARYKHSQIEVCHMEHRKPAFPDALAKLSAAGATRIIVMPYFLHLGMHMQRDIPELMRAEAAKFPHLKIILGKNLGFDETLVDLVEKRLGESAGLPDIRETRNAG